MERHKSALKAARQAVKRTARNSAALSSVRTNVKKLRTAIATAKTGKGDKVALATMLNEVQRTLMKAASKNLIKAKTASRQVARLSKAVHQASA